MPQPLQLKLASVCFLFFLAELIDWYLGSVGNNAFPSPWRLTGTWVLTPDMISVWIHPHFTVSRLPAPEVMNGKLGSVWPLAGEQFRCPVWIGGLFCTGIAPPRLLARIPQTTSLWWYAIFFPSSTAYLLLNTLLLTPPPPNPQGDWKYSRAGYVNQVTGRHCVPKYHASVLTDLFIVLRNCPSPGANMGSCHRVTMYALSHFA